MPPDARNTANPSLSPPQLGFTWNNRAQTNGAGSVIVTFILFSHPLKSRTMRVYIPVERLGKYGLAWDVAKLSIEYKYGGVPPDAMTAKLPLE